MNEERSQNRIPEISRDLPDEEQERILWETLDWFEPGPDGKQISALSPEEVKRLRVLSRGCSTGVRRFVVEFLLYNYDAPLSWEDLEAWSLDPDSEIRSLAIGAVDLQSGPFGKMCSDDKARCAEIVAKSIERYPSDAIEFQQLMWDSDEWLDVIWGHIGLLLDTAKPELFTKLTSSFLVEVLKSRDWGPDDPHISPWIESDRTQRKMAILGAALSLWPVEGNLRQIVEALTHDPDPVIAHIAKVALREDTGRMELTMDHYELVRNRLALGDGVFE